MTSVVDRRVSRVTQHIYRYESGSEHRNLGLLIETLEILGEGTRPVKVIRRIDWVPSL